ncbi:Tumor necrosis factor ligand superfamily member 14 [Labeo rohita]|uniref:Tumor necrosis factor ligand superfamily member 14 n=1 Tax=Labeo rohita TaxID=84645 RepID=A0ABQ8N1I6_LABRO|nr:tumor necrosis factor ligand superfamily member 14 [Labeo rohita]KAI2668965.1 Tumor necrosis factor ligand superfamily member 14 [Labeo rohita]
MADTGESVNKNMNVFVVDSQALPRQVAIRTGGRQLYVIYLLLAVALLGVFIEAGLIWHLYRRPVTSSDPVNAAGNIPQQPEKYSSSHGSNEILPPKLPQAESKPAALLQIASPASGGNGVLQWRTDSYPVFMRALEYKNNSLYIQQDGYYYIFSKIAYLDTCKYFKHQVMQCTERYNFKAIELMQNSRLICASNKSHWRDNSYLGGIFHLFKGDSVFVKVNNSSQVHGEPYENYFGAFMV